MGMCVCVAVDPSTWPTLKLVSKLFQNHFVDHDYLERKGFVVDGVMTKYDGGNIVWFNWEGKCLNNEESIAGLTT